MGLPVVRRFLRAGNRVAVFDPHAGRVEEALVAGAEPLDPHVGPATLDVLVTVLPGAAEVASLAGTLTGLRPGALWLDLTSGDPRTTNALASRLRAGAVATVGAAMGGGPAGAATGSLDLFVGGSPTDVDRVRPLLAALSRDGGSVRHVGPQPGAGQLVKLLANLLWFHQSVAVTESLLLARSAGLDVRVVRDALAGSAGDSEFLRRHVDHLLRGDHLADFGLDRVVEELDVLEEMAAGSATPYDVGRAVTRLHHEALARFGPVDGELLAAKLLEERGGGPLHEDP